jgi:hypothetical protein
MASGMKSLSRRVSAKAASPWDLKTRRTSAKQLLGLGTSPRTEAINTASKSPLEKGSLIASAWTKRMPDNRATVSEMEHLSLKIEDDHCPPRHEVGNRGTEEPWSGPNLEDTGIRCQTHGGNRPTRRLHEMAQRIEQRPCVSGREHLPTAQPDVRLAVCHDHVVLRLVRSIARPIFSASGH